MKKLREVTLPMSGSLRLPEGTVVLGVVLKKTTKHPALLCVMNEGFESEPQETVMRYFAMLGVGQEVPENFRFLGEMPGGNTYLFEIEK